MGWTPCMEKDETMPIGQQFNCPFSNDPTSSMCEQCDYDYNERQVDYETERYEF